MSSGWWYTLAEGPLAADFCSEIEAEATSLSVPVSPEQTLKLAKIDCGVLGFAQAKCYASQRPAVNGNSRYMTALAVKGDCRSTVLFRGSKAILKNGKPIRVPNWINPYAGIPEESNEP